MRKLVSLVVLSLVIGLAVGGAVGMATVSPDESFPPAIETPAPGPQEPTKVATTTSNYSALYQQTIDSVVKIRINTAQGTAQGSGFVYDGRHVVTNEHVVGDANTVLVQFSNGVWHTGRVVGTDVYTDLAVIRLSSMPTEATPLPVTQRDPKPGVPVAALGSPFGLQGTITQGIVSGVNRSMRVEGGFSIPDTVQTDAPINPGNSGGPLVSMDGSVVGVNRAKEGDNIGFAISAAVVRQVVPELIDDGQYEHSYLGIRTLPVTPEIAESKGLDEATGLVVVETIEGTPAAANLQSGNITPTESGPRIVGGDVIVGIDDQQVYTNQELSRYLLLQTQPGETVELTVIRDGERQTIPVRLTDRPDVE